MTEQLKLIVQELANPPFSQNFNLITFDSLEPIQLLQVLSDVFCTIQDLPQVDIRQEPSDETALRLLNFLRLNRFPHPTDPDELSIFRQGLVEGDKHVIHSVLLWIFPRVEELQKRIYLAKFLVKVEVPPEFTQDMEVAQMLQKLEDTMEEFKAVHKTLETVKTDGMSSEDIRRDIQSMEQERDQVTKRIQKVKKKIEHAPNKEQMLEAARNLRLESEREMRLVHQKQEQRNALLFADQKAQRLEQALRDIQQQAESLRPDDVIKKLEEENQTNSYLVKEKLPKEIDIKRKAVQELQKVVSQPAIDDNDLAGLRAQIDEVNNEINAIVEKRHVMKNPTEDKLGLFRQQASMVSRKKEAAAQSMQELKLELATAETELREKKQQMRDADGNEIITQTQYKNYVNKIRGKTSQYKKKRVEIQDLRAELGVVNRTLEILMGQATSAGVDMAALDSAQEDSSLGGQDPQGTHHNSSMEAMEGKSKDEMLLVVKHLKSALDEQKNKLRPLQQEMGTMREQLESFTHEHANRKREYEATQTSMESEYAVLEQEVNKLRSEMNKAQSDAYRLEAELRVTKAMMDRTQTDGNQGKSFQELINQRIAEAESEGKKMKEDQKSMGEGQQVSAKQMKMWRDLARVLECKKMLWERANPKVRTDSGTIPGPPDSRASVHTAGSRKSATGTRPGSSAKRRHPPSETMLL